MFKIFLKFVLIYLVFVNPLIAQTIKKIEVKGNKRISENTIVVLSKIELDQDFSDDKINNALKNLYDTDFFSDISFNLKENTLEIIVIENPIIEDIKIIGIKNKDFTEKVYELISLKNRKSFSKTALNKDLIIIKNILKTNGFYFAKVDVSQITDDKLNSIQLTINIEQGKKAKIKKIKFIGDKKIKDKKLLEVIASEEHEFWKFISNKVYLNQSTIELDKRLLGNYYKNLGYHEVQVLNSFAEFNNDGYFELIFNINSGNQFYFNDFKLELPIDYNESDFADIKKIFKKLKNKRYSLDDLNLILSEIDEIASSRLYDFIDVEVEESIIDNNKIAFTFNVVDSKKHYVERINVLGNYSTIEEVVRNRLIVDEGDPLNTLLYNKSIENIRNLRIFKKVDAVVKDGSDENLKIIDITVEEQPTGEISLAAGVGTSGSTIGGGITEKNFLGKGINLTTNLELSEDAIKGRFVYSKPNFNYTDNTLFTSLESTTTDYLSDYGYKVSNLGFSIGTEFEQYENLFFSPELAASIEDLSTNSSASSQLKKQEGSYQDFYFNYGLNYDLRNNGYKPTSGNKTSFYQKLPVVTDNNEITNTFIFTQYKNLNQQSEMIGRASLYLKAINSIDGSDVRISKRGSMPYNRLRGFEKGKVGPVDQSDYIGGNYISALNLSTNLPGILSTVETVDFTYFIDVANVWGVDYSSAIDDSNVVRSSTGIAVDLISPIGPLSFSFTRPITKKSTDKTESFRFNLGTTF